MYELFLKTEKFNPLVLAAYKNEKLCGVLMGVLIHEINGPGKLLSSRFVIYGGPLLKGDEVQKKTCLELLLKKLIRETRKKALFIQFRNFTSQENFIPIYNKLGFHLIDRLNYIINISSQDVVLKNMSESRRRQVKKALKSGVEIIEPQDISQVREFYNILYRLYRFKVQKPLPDWSFFENFYQNSINGRLGIIRLIKLEDKIIGGILSPVLENKCIYEWYVCGLDRECKNQYPSVLATWAGLEYAINNNIQHFDFMGVGKPEKEYGVRDFKARFGGELVNYGRITRINNRFLYSIAELCFNVLALFKKI